MGYQYFCSLLTATNIVNYVIQTIFYGASNSKESACNVGDLGPSLGREDPVGKGMATQYSWLENPHGQRCLVGYSPWGHKESDMIERLTLM